MQRSLDMRIQTRVLMRGGILGVQLRRFHTMTSVTLSTLFDRRNDCRFLSICMSLLLVTISMMVALSLQVMHSGPMSRHYTRKEAGSL
jgi:hypothetical protein